MIIGDVSKLDLRDVVRFYFDKEVEKVEGKRHYVNCVFHEDGDPSLALFDKGTHWDCYCFACGKGGTAIDMLIHNGLAETKEDAEAKLRKDFNLELPKEVTMEVFAQLKGFDIDYLKTQGVENVDDGFVVPFYNANQDLVARKTRVKYVGKQKYKYDTTVENRENNPIYGLHLLKKFNSETNMLYLCEGETDTWTMNQSGLHAMGIPGSQTFKTDHATSIQGFEWYVMVKDQDAAGASLMRKVAKDIPNLLVLNLPKEYNDVNEYWNHGVKRDKDAFVKYMKDAKNLEPYTPESFLLGCKAKMFEPDDVATWEKVLSWFDNNVEIEKFKARFLDEVPTADKKMVTLAIKDAKSANTPGTSNYINPDSNKLVRKGNSYCKIVYKRGAELEIPVTNFVIEVAYVTESSDGDQIRFMNLKNEDGQITSRPVAFSGSDLTSSANFKRVCASKGGFNFMGTDQDIALIFAQVIQDTKGKRVIHDICNVGHVNGAWIFDNIAIDKAGNVLKRNEDNTFTIEGKHYKISSLVASSEENISDFKPHFNTDYLEEDLSEEKRQLARLTLKSYGNNYDVWSALGWAVSGYYSDVIFKKYNRYPLMFIKGIKNSGKTSLASMLMKFYGGINGSSIASSSENTTLSSIAKSIGYVRSLPMWLDDYRGNNHKCTQKDGLYLNSYNRQARRLNSKNGDLITHPVNGFFLLSGESITKDEALRTRTLFVEVESTKNDHVAYEELLNIEDYANDLGLQFCVASQCEENQEKILGLIDKYMKEIKETTKDRRLAEKMSVFISGFVMGFGDVLEPKELEDYIRHTVKGAELEKQGSENAKPHIVMLNDFASMISDERSDVKLLAEQDFAIRGDALYIKMQNCYRKWLAFNKMASRDLFPKDDLEAYLLQSPFCDGKDKKVRVGSTGQFLPGRYVKLNLPQLEHEATELVEYLRYREELREAAEPDKTVDYPGK